jgi:osmotically-inducible protein OsmY
MKTLSLLCLSTVLAAGALVGLSGCAGDRYHESTGEYIDDNALTARVKDALGHDVYKFDGVQVTSFKGVVQLSGFVDHGEQRDRAAQIASTVQGVREVRNSITVKP